MLIFQLCARHFCVSVQEVFQESYGDERIRQAKRKMAGKALDYEIEKSDAFKSRIS